MSGVSAVFLTALSFLGCFFSAMRFGENILNDAVGLLLAFGVTVLIVLSLMRLKNRFSALSEHKTAKAAVSAIVFLVILFALLENVAIFSSYASKNILHEAEILSVAFLLLGVSVFAALSGERVLLKTGLLIFPITVLFVAVMFAFSVPYMDVKYILPYKKIELYGIMAAFLRYILKFLPFALISTVGIGKFGVKNIVKGLVLGITIGAFCLVNTVAVFGAEVAAVTQYPYTAAVGVAAVGDIFSRMDGFLYAVYFFSYYTFSAMSIYSLGRLLKIFVAVIKDVNLLFCDNS